jgi:hypothetical protein
MPSTKFKNDMTITGALTVDGALSFGGTALTVTAAQLNTIGTTGGRAVTATADGLTTGLLAVTDNFVTVTSASANNIIMLPAGPASLIGKEIRGWIGANGCEVRSFGTASTINGLDCKTTNEAALAATGMFTCTLVAAETWLLEYLTELGAVTTIVPDAV